MAVPIGRAVLSAGLVLTTALAGCSSSGDGDGSGTSGNSAETCPAPHAPGIPSSVSAKMAVTRAYKMFFDTDTAIGHSVAVLQHGAMFCDSLLEAGKNPAATKITARI